MNHLESQETSKIKRINAWMYDESMFPPNECIYVVAFNISDIELKLTKEELSVYKYFLFVHSTHFFREFDMPKFDILFIDGWKKDSKSRVTDYDMINFAIKSGVKVIGYKGVNEGENSHLLDTAAYGKELKFHGLIDQDSPLDSIRFHPEADVASAEKLKGL